MESPPLQDVPQKHGDKTEVSTLGNSLAPDARPVQARHPSFATKVGRLSLFILSASLGFSLLCLAWFTFLWWGSADIAFWQRIVIDGWLIRAISLPASALRLAVSLQAGICLSMLAALAFEKFSIPYSKVAATSIMRAGSPSLSSFYSDLLFPMMRHRTGAQIFRTWILLGLAIGITLTSSALGFNSTILLSDVTILPVPAYNTTLAQMGIDFSYGPPFLYRAPRINNVWSSNRPSTFPIFAEYSEPPSKQLENLTDTGVSLRAFLPFANPAERESIRNFTGRAMIFDSRVICQKPNIANLALVLPQGPANSEGREGTVGNLSGINGTLLRSTHTDKLDVPPEVSFYCASSEGLSICQLPNNLILQPRDSQDDPPTGSSYSGGVTSEFRGPNTFAYSGAAYLVLYITGETVQTGIESPSAPPSLGPDWSQYILSDTSGHAFVPGYSSYRWIAASACYAALDAADRYVEIFSNRNRTELSAFRNNKTPLSTYNFTHILPQLVPGQPPKSAQDRGILEIRHPIGGWAAEFDSTPGSDGPWEVGANKTITYPETELQLPYLVNALNIQVPKVNLLDYIKPTMGNFSAVFLPGYDAAQENAISFSFAAQPWISDLFMGALNASGSNTAVALQSVLTTLAGISYYDKLPEFDKVVNTTAIFFNDVATVGGAYGLPRAQRSNPLGLSDRIFIHTIPSGFLTVAILVFVQLVLAVTICIRFARECIYSRLSDPWQAVAHVISSPESYGYATASSHLTSDRKTVSNLMEANDTQNDSMTLEQNGGFVKLTRRTGYGSA